MTPPRLIINSAAPNKDGLLHSFQSKRPGPQSLALFAGNQELELFFVRPQTSPLPFWESDSDIEAGSLVASIAVGNDAPIALDGAFTAAESAGDFMGFKTTLEFNDDTLPYFETGNGKPFTATLTVRHESPAGMNLILSYPVNIMPYPTSLPAWEDTFYNKSQTDAAIAAQIAEIPLTTSFPCAGVLAVGNTFGYLVLTQSVEAVGIQIYVQVPTNGDTEIELLVDGSSVATAALPANSKVADTAFIDPIAIGAGSSIQMRVTEAGGTGAEVLTAVLSYRLA